MLGALDLEKLLANEPDDFRPLSLELEIFEQGSPSQRELQEIVQLAVDFFRQFGIIIHPTYSHEEFTFPEIGQKNGKLSIVFCTSQEFSYLGECKDRLESRHRRETYYSHRPKGVGTASTLLGVALIDLSSSRELVHEESEGNTSYATLVAQTLVHEIGHLLGLWHSYDPVVNRLIPNFFSLNVNGREWWIPNFMHVLHSQRYDDNYPAKLSVRASDFQVRYMRSFLRRGVVYQELARHEFDFMPLAERIWKYELHRQR